MRGDILFYTPRDFVDKIIAKVTNGPYSHVAISLGDGTSIAADWTGIQQRPEVPPASVYSPKGDIEAGITWLKAQVGKQYGWFDVFDAFLRLTVGASFYVFRPNTYDCSDLATRYLSHVVGEEVSDEPHLITPNDLARSLHALPLSHPASQ